jgi:hypothetical protein
MRTSPVSEFLYANCGAANFGGSRPFEAALRQDDERRLKKPACRHNWRPHPAYTIWEIALALRPDDSLAI